MERRFSWLAPDLRERVLADLAGPMPRGRGRLSHRTPLRGLDRPELDGRRHVVFVSYYPYLHTAKKSLALRATGRYATTLLCCCAREDALAGRWFDQVYEAGDYGELLALLDTAAPWAVMAHIQPSLLGALALEGAGNRAAVLLDVNDSQYFMQRDPESLPCRLERAVLGRAHGFAHKMPPPAVAEIRAAWPEVAAPDGLAHSLPWREFFREGGAGQGPPHRLVYAGGIMPRRIAIRDGHAHMVMDPLIEGTAGGRLRLTILANSFSRESFWEEHAEYLDMERRLPHFSFRPGVPFHRLPDELAGFHYGLLYDNLPVSSYRPECYTYNMSTKVFSYLEAGLPILVYDAFAYIADLVREHGLGLVYSLERMQDIPGLIEAADYGRLKDNVRRYRERFELATTLDGLEGLLDAARSHRGE